MQKILRASYFLFIGIYAVASCEHLPQNRLQRGGKSIKWKWSIKQYPDIQRKRRFLTDSHIEEWWKEMEALRDQKALGSLTPTERVNFVTESHLPPFDSKDTFRATTEDEVPTTEESLQPHDIEPSLLREAIIDELHKPSKIELKSAFHRLREATDRNATAKPPASNRTARNENFFYNVASAVGYVEPSVEFVSPHVEYAENSNNLQSEVEYVAPKIEYLEPSVEFVKPFVEYSIKDDNNVETNSSAADNVQLVDDTLPNPSTLSKETELTERRGYFDDGDHDISLSEIYAIEDNKRTRYARQTPYARRELRLSDEEYPALEAMPVAQFRCDRHAPGYYVDVSLKCQVFHVCQEDGRQNSFLCPVGTLFNQDFMICDWWYNVNCRSFEPFHSSEPFDVLGSSNQKFTVQGSSILNQPHDYANYFRKDDDFSPIHVQKKPNAHLEHFEQDTKSEVKVQSGFNSVPSKSVNYPIGYAILLREYVKSSSGSIQNNFHNSGQKEQINAHPDKIDGATTSSFVKSDVNGEKYFQVAENNRREPHTYFFGYENDDTTQKPSQYFGGSKPFSLPKTENGDEFELQSDKFQLEENAYYKNENRTGKYKDEEKTSHQIESLKQEQSEDKEFREFSSAESNIKYTRANSKDALKTKSVPNLPNKDNNNEDNNQAPTLHSESSTNNKAPDNKNLESSMTKVEVYLGENETKNFKPNDNLRNSVEEVRKLMKNSYTLLPPTSNVKQYGTRIRKQNTLPAYKTTSKPSSEMSHNPLLNKTLRTPGMYSTNFKTRAEYGKPNLEIQNEFSSKHRIKLKNGREQISTAETRPGNRRTSNNRRKKVKQIYIHVPLRSKGNSSRSKPNTKDNTVSNFAFENEKDEFVGFQNETIKKEVFSDYGGNYTRSNTITISVQVEGKEISRRTKTILPTNHETKNDTQHNDNNDGIVLQRDPVYYPTFINNDTKQISFLTQTEQNFNTKTDCCLEGANTNGAVPKNSTLNVKKISNSNGGYVVIKKVKIEKDGAISADNLKNQAAL